MKYKLKVYNILEFGMRVDSNGNPHQEDSIFPDFGMATDDDRLFILCDGMGGHDAGEVASATVCEAMSKTILNATDPEGHFDINMVRSAINNAYDMLDSKDTGASKKMGTTMTMLKLYDKGAVVAHIGDSRVYHIRPGHNAASTRVLYRTWDHSLVCDLIRAGVMTEEEAKTSPQRNIITKAMQPLADNRSLPTIKKIRDIRPGDYFYLCSDGMLEQMDIPELKQIFSEEGGDDLTKVQTLVDLTTNNHDNHTAIIVHITDVIDPVDATIPPDEFDINYTNTYDGLPQFDEETTLFAPDAPQKSAPATMPVAAAPATAHAPVAQPDGMAQYGNDAEDSTPARKMLVWLVAALSVLLVALCAWIFWPSNDKSEDEKTEETTEETTDKPTKSETEDKAVKDVINETSSEKSAEDKIKDLAKEDKKDDKNKDSKKKDDKKDDKKKDDKKDDKKKDDKKGNKTDSEGNKSQKESAEPAQQPQPEKKTEPAPTPASAAEPDKTPATAQPTTNTPKSGDPNIFE